MDKIGRGNVSSITLGGEMSMLHSLNLSANKSPGIQQASTASFGNILGDINSSNSRKVAINSGSMSFNPKSEVWIRTIAPSS